MHDSPQAALSDFRSKDRPLLTWSSGWLQASTLCLAWAQLRAWVMRRKRGMVNWHVICFQAFWCSSLASHLLCCSSLES